MAANIESSTATIWERKFPTFVGGSSCIAVARPSTSAAAAGSRPRLNTYPVRPHSREAHPIDAQQQQQQQQVVRTGDALYSEILPGQPASQKPQQQATATGTTRGRSPLRMKVDRPKDAVPQSAYDHFSESVNRLQHQLHAIPLQKRWELMAAWLDRFALNEAAERMATDAAALHEEVCKVTADRGETNGLRTAVSFMLLEQAIFVLGFTYPNLLPLAETVRNDVLNAVYISPDTKLDLSSSFFIMSDPRDPEEQRQLIDRYYKKTYYQCLRETATKLNQKTYVFESAEKTKDKQMRILSRVVDYWQRYTVRLMFKAWRGYIGGRRVKRGLNAKLHALQKQVDDHSNAISAVAAARESAVENSAKVAENLQARIAELRTSLDASEHKNRALQAKLDAQDVRFEDDPRVKKLLAEIQSLRGGGMSRLQSADMAPQEQSFVIGDDRDTETESLRAELAVARSRIAELEKEVAHSTAM